MIELLNETLSYVLTTLIHNSPSLALGILVASAIKVYVDPQALKNAIMRRSGISIPGSVTFGAFTPFCACGTMAIIVSMLTTALPWGPIMAFIVSSPLMSPDLFVMLSGVIGLRFAVMLAAASVIIGLSAGYITYFIEKNTCFLDNQTRFNEVKGGPPASSQIKDSCCSEAASTLSDIKRMADKYRLKDLFDTIIDIGFKKVLLYFSLFAGVGYFINEFVPAELILKYFSPDNIFAVPLSAIIGLPLYVSGSSSLPIIKVLLEGGASEGAMLAFLITGPGTSVGVIAGITTIMRRKAIALYVAYILIGGVVLGYIYDLLLRFII